MFVFLLLTEKKEPPKNDNSNFWVWVFLSKNGRFVTHNCFWKIGVLKPLFFIVFWGCALSGPSCQKGIFGTPPQKRKFRLIFEKLIFWYFLVCLLIFPFFFFLYLLFLCFCYFLLFYFWGFKGQVRWPEGLPHLALNPPFMFCFFCFFFGGGLRVRWGGPKGHLTWPLSPPYFVVLCFCFPLFAVFPP